MPLSPQSTQGDGDGPHDAHPGRTGHRDRDPRIRAVLDQRDLARFGAPLDRGAQLGAATITAPSASLSRSSASRSWIRRRWTRGHRRGPNQLGILCIEYGRGRDRGCQSGARWSAVSWSAGGGPKRHSSQACQTRRSARCRTIRSAATMARPASAATSSRVRSPSASEPLSRVISPATRRSVRIAYPADWPSFAAAERVRHGGHLTTADQVVERPAAQPDHAPGMVDGLDTGPLERDSVRPIGGRARRRGQGVPIGQLARTAGDTQHQGSRVYPGAAAARPTRWTPTSVQPSATDCGRRQPPPARPPRAHRPVRTSKRGPGSRLAGWAAGETPGTSDRSTSVRQRASGVGSDRCGSR